MDPFIENLIIYQIERYYSIFLSLSFLLGALYLLPGIQAIYTYSKKKWLEKQLSKIPSSGEGEDKLRQQLMEAAEPSQSYPIYKIFKFYFASTGIAIFIIGMLMVLLPDDLGPDAFDWLLFIPSLIGISLYLVYNATLKGEGLYREVAAVFLYVGCASTALMAYGQFEMYDWLRADILAFGILSLGGFIIWHMQSTLVSYLYMISVAIAGATVYFQIEDNWLYFLPHLLWVFAIAILYVWIPKLRATKDIGAKEIIFGILFTMMIMSLTMTQLSAESGLLLPSLAVVLPGLYIFSKAYYFKADSIIGRPIEIFIILVVVFMGITLSTNDAMTSASDSIYLFKQYSFEKQVSYFILLGLIGGIFWLLNDLNDSTEEINPLVAILPFTAFLVAYVLGEYGGHYIMAIYLLGLGYLYARKGIDQKDSIRLALGASVFVYTVIFKMIDMWGEHLFDDKTTTGLSLMLFGAIYLGAVVYVRNEWTVSGSDENQKYLSTNDELIDKE